jgi:5'-nucleotidase (lipoprotein e(P4) family)
MKWIALSLVVIAGCAKPPATNPAPAPAPADAVAPNIRWFRASAEKRAIYIQTYRSAAASILRRSQGLQPNTFGVILDADETVLDNSPYEVTHPVYDEATWNEWVRSERAEVLPGALAFTQQVHNVGGRVVIVTNRDDRYCDATRSNLRKVGIVADEVLCKTDPVSDDKNPRFEAVQKGVAPSVLPAMRVLMWVGDNIQDFPHLSQDIRKQGDAAFADFGEGFVVLPNPMYGSWTRNSLP